MRTALAFIPVILATLVCAYSPVHAAPAAPSSGSDNVEETVWALEEAYFTNLYRADYDGVLALVHRQFLGWPGAAAQPIDRDGSARFMRQLIPTPTSCTIRIERAGIRVIRAVAFTEYTLHVRCKESGGAGKTTSSRITHTWVKEAGRWQLLGGMSFDV